MKPRHQNRRLATFALCATIAIVGAYLLVSALKDNTQLFHNPSGVLAPDFIAKSDLIRVGGVVEVGSIERGLQLTSQFVVHDYENPNNLPDRLRVTYTGVLPDLFREGEIVYLRVA